MRFLKDYSSLPDYLARKTILKFRRLHVRFHEILSEDKTPFLHSHPFYYMSVVLKGGYIEELLKDGEIIEKKHKVGSIILRRPKDFHRIKSIQGPSKTLFMTWKVNERWSLKKHSEVSCEGYEFPQKNGIYFRVVRGRKLFTKFEDFWYIGNETLCGAIKETRCSIHQCIEYTEL